MSLYYKLQVNDSLKIAENKIGEAVSKINTDSEINYGFSFANIYLPDDIFKVYEKYLECNGIVPVQEEILKMNMSDDEKVEYIGRYLAEIESIDKDLYITDQYIFPYNYDMDYQKFLRKILKKSSARKIFFVTNSKYNQKLAKEISQSLKDCSIIINDECHDRFWIVPEINKGFILGTSLNSLGRKICRIDILNSEEVCCIKNMLKIDKITIE